MLYYCLAGVVVLGLSRQSVAADTPLHSSDDTPAVDTYCSWNFTSGFQVSPGVPELLHEARESRWLCFCAQS